MTTDLVAQSPVTIAQACQLVAEHYQGARGVFAYQAFEYVNATSFANALPWPLILWTLTPHSACLGLTRATDGPPVIQLHPAVLGGSERTTPWGMNPDHLGPAFAFDVLLHECIHLAVQTLRGGGEGPTSHNNPAWVAEVNRLAPLQGFPDFIAGGSTVQRVREPGTTGPGKVQRQSGATLAGEPVPYATTVARFPYGLRVHLGQTDWYTETRLPFPHALERGGNAGAERPLVDAMPPDPSPNKVPRANRANKVRRTRD
jgi:hypothetical protein